MNSFNEIQTKEGYLQRLNLLTPASQARWGKMNVQQMLNHLNELFLTATGQKAVKDSVGVKMLSIVVGGVFKKRIIHSKKPFPKGIGNAPLPAAADFETEKGLLVGSLLNCKPSQFTKKSLSVFGKMSPELWDKFLVRQFEHHLSQFGV